MSDEATKQAFDAWYENYPDLDSYDQGMLDAFAAGRAFALETAAKECERHAEFFKSEADNVGAVDHLLTRREEATMYHLLARREEAIYNAQRIREFKGPQC